MLKRVFQIFFVILGGTLGYLLIPELLLANHLFGIDQSFNKIVLNLIGIALGGLVLFLLTAWFMDTIIRWIQKGEEFILKIPVTDFLFGLIGMIFGLIISTLLSQAIKYIPVINLIVPIFLSIILGYFGFRLGFKKRDEFMAVFSLGKFNKEKATKKDSPKYEHKILDTSVIIDGRIADICKTGFIEGILVIPSFVLAELQHIADSSDTLKRNRGRRGLDILNKIQKELDIKVLIYEGDFEEIQEVDSKLVKLAKVLEGKVVTNDYNLNKICELQGVPVLNINDLSNAVKPVVLPGEELNVQVIKDGKEHNQGIAYLDDGTMIVVEGGREYIGHHLDVLVTSVLQTSAGRMIFAKPKLLEKAL
ncbi:PIN/TRAM domain-containing protein [Tepidibacillus sp. LV47]|uniref:PIN/TRAM domain-containing protein n=1 Tax=Tepidibacillus sp. LV47 TaxID=3398228 RepID=UPI003AAAB21E